MLDQGNSQNASTVISHPGIAFPYQGASMHACNGYGVFQVSALGRRLISLSATRSMAKASVDRLNDQSTGEVYEVCWHIGLPRK